MLQRNSDQLLNPDLISDNFKPIGTQEGKEFYNSSLFVSTSDVKLATGFLTVFVFSRFIERQVLWQGIMGDGYMRVVKTAVEESTELFGYTLILIGILEFLRDALMADKSSFPSAVGVAFDSITTRYKALPGHHVSQITTTFEDKSLHHSARYRHPIRKHR